jgi:methylmalonyl-CoA/ethylmalonyl-CoA epimerase
MAGSLHHIGFVVSQISTSVDGFTRALGASWNGQVFEDPHQGVKVTFLSTRPGEAQIELVEPNGENSPVRSFLESKGGGLHHLCYEIDDLDFELSERRLRGALLVKRPKPAVAFGGRRIAWVLTPETLLLELLEAANAQSSGDR